MTAVNKIDSNNTGLAYAEEESIGVLGGSPVWKSLSPNSYDDFGGEITTVAPRPINPSRQRRKGVVTDLDASGGFNQNLNYTGLSDIMQGFMFADMRRKGHADVASTDANTFFSADIDASFLVGSLVKGDGFDSSSNNALFEVTAVSSGVSVDVDGTLVVDGSTTGAVLDVVGYQSATGDIDVVTTGDFATLTSTVLDFTTLGLVAGQWIFIGGDSASLRFTNAANNGFKRIRSVDANAVVIDKSYLPMVAEANAAQDVQIFFGDVLKNEQAGLITRRSYHLERTLGQPDDASVATQSEVLKGAVPDEITLNVPTADLVTIDMSFMATDNEQRTAAQGPLQTSVQNFLSSDDMNSSSDVGRMRLTLVSATNESVDSLFAYVTEAKVMVKNNLSMNKAVGILGSFDVTAGVFEVSGELTAYFSNVTAVQAVRNNSDVTLDISFIKDNQGIVFDMPLIALGNGRLNVEIDEPITLPLVTDAASGEDVHPNLNHTLLVTYFNYLPEAAM